MILTFRPIKTWPEGWPNEDYRTSPFSSTYAKTLTLLDRELRHLDATDVILQLDASDRDCRLDGQLRANAKVGYRGVILSFQSADHGTMTYSCDEFTKWNATEAWQANLRAVALGLEALRTVERYGIAGRGQQYAGYAELGTGIALGTGMSLVEAMEYLRVESGWEGDWFPLDDRIHIDVAFKAAAKRLHPDSGGDPEAFRKLTEARDFLLGYPH